MPLTALAVSGQKREYEGMIGIARWLLTVLGGVLLGSGLVLHSQVALARHMRSEVDSTFFLWRTMGRATFMFQGGETRIALAMSEIPDETLKQSEQVAWVLVIVGGLVAGTGPILWRRRVVPKSARKA